MSQLLSGADNMEREFKDADDLVAAIIAKVGSVVPGSNRRIDPYAYAIGTHLLGNTAGLPWDALLYVLFMRADSTNFSLLNTIFPRFLSETPEAWRQE